MRKKYGLLIILIIFIVSGIGASIINRYYSFDYLYHLLIRREFSINPKAEILADKTYQLSVWYYPFFRTIPERQGQEKAFFQSVINDLQKQYPNIQLRIRELDFLNGKKELEKALQEGNPPDLYFNFTNDSLIDERWQVPVEDYISTEERAGFYTINWSEYSSKNHLWAWPFLIEKQYWLANQRIPEIQEGADFITQIKQLEQKRLLLNIHDLTLLRQFLTLQGLEKIGLEDDKLNPQTAEAFRGVFNFFHDLRQKQSFALSSSHMDGEIIKEFLSDKPLVIGPINPWLGNYFARKEKQIRLELDNLYQLYTLAVFYQKDYQGNDHTRATMELAGIISKNYGQIIADSLGLRPAFEENKEGENLKQIIAIEPEIKEYFREEIIPAWQDFWLRGLTPEETMDRL